MAGEDGRLWITFNGEIYNFLELRRELEAAGHRFRSHTDTEVILAAYAHWGLDCVDRLAGMFAFAIWDEPRRRLWVVRDRLGKKPLYYAESRGTLRFASELKAIVADPAVPREIDPDAMRLYLRYGYVPSPHTIYAGVRKLPPAHFLLCENATVSVRRYWDPVPYALDRTSMTDADAEAELETRLTTAVRQRMIADVPLGAFLSGGIDSSLIVALMQEQSAVPVKTFTIRFDDPEFNEADHAAAVARHLRTDHHEETCDERQMLDVVDRLADMFDEPFADSSAVPTYLVSKIARGSVTVALSGDGGDELFLGYPRYRLQTQAAAALALPRGVRRAVAFGADRLPTRRLRRIANVLRSDEADPYAHFISWWRMEDIAAMTGQPPPDGPAYADALARSAGLHRQDRAGLVDLVSYLPEDILTKVDRASMAVSLEVRAPLLDHRVVEFALGLPSSLKRRRPDEVAVAEAARSTRAARADRPAQDGVWRAAGRRGSAVRCVSRWTVTSAAPISNRSASIRVRSGACGPHSRTGNRIAAICSGRCSCWRRGPAGSERLSWRRRREDSSCHHPPERRRSGAACRPARSRAARAGARDAPGLWLPRAG